MAIPTIEASGWLPPGEHTCTLAEVQACFASDKHSSKRQRLFAVLTEHLKKPLLTDLAEVVLIDGGFVSGKPRPKDVDIIIGLKVGTIADLLAGQLGIHSRAALALLEGRLSEPIDGHRPIHGFADDVGGPKFEGLRAYFQMSDRIGDPRRKGILRLEYK